MSKIKAVSKVSRLSGPECIDRAMPVIYTCLPKVFYIYQAFCGQRLNSRKKTRKTFFFSNSEISLIQKGS